MKIYHICVYFYESKVFQNYLFYAVKEEYNSFKNTKYVFYSDGAL